MDSHIFSNFYLKIILVALFFRFIYLFILLPGQYPDEVFIYERVYSSAASKFFPDKLVNHTEYYPNNEYPLPPLYFEANSYLLYVVSLINGSINFDFAQSFEKNIYIFRLQSLIVSIATLFFYWKILHRLKVNNNVKKISFVMLSLLPAVSVYSGGMSFHTHIFLLMAIVIYMFMGFNIKRNNSFTFPVLGIIMGIAVLIHFEGIIILALVFAYLFFTRKDIRVLRSLTLVLVLSFVFGGWWYLANIIQFGSIYDPKLVEANKAAGFISPFSIPNYIGVMFNHTFETFFYTAGRTNNLRLDYIGYLVWKVVAVFILFGLFMAYRFRQQKDLIKMPILKSMIFSFIVNIVLFWNLNLVHNLAPQGRYFYPSFLLISLLFSFGLVSLFKKEPKYLIFVIVSFFITMNVWGMNCVFKVYYNFSILPNNIGCFNYPF